MTQHDGDPKPRGHRPGDPPGTPARARAALGRYLGFGPSEAEEPQSAGRIVLTRLVPIALFMGVVALIGEGIIVSLLILLALGFAWGLVLRLFERTR
jgi:hypothetical protein